MVDISKVSEPYSLIATFLDYFITFVVKYTFCTDLEPWSVLSERLHSIKYVFFHKCKLLTLKIFLVLSTFLLLYYSHNVSFHTFYVLTTSDRKGNVKFV